MKTALVDISLNILDEVLAVIKDHGFELVGVARDQPEAAIRFIIEGDALPDECEDPGMLVSPLMTVRSYGRQRFTEITELRMLGRPQQRIAA